jgi:hypothetical protein
MPLLDCALAKTSSLSSLMPLKEPETSGNDNGRDCDEHQYHAAAYPFYPDPICILPRRRTIRESLPDGIDDPEITGNKGRRKEKQRTGEEYSDSFPHNFHRRRAI